MQVRQVVFNTKRTLSKKNVCAYARVSVDDDDMLHSLNNQIMFYKEEILSHPEWNFVGVFHDKPMTGTKENRPEFLRMIELCRQGKIDMIITKSISRFARNTLTTLKYVRELTRLGVDVFFESQNLHTITAEGEFFLSLYAGMAQAESLSVSENCKWRIRKNFEAGIMTPCSILGYDFQDGTLVINEEEAKIVRLIFAKYLEGKGYQTIADEMNAAGYTSKWGRTFTQITISTILHNEKYNGDVLLQKWFRIDHLSKKEVANNGELDKFFVGGHHEAIIDSETFEKVQSLLSVNRSKFTGKKQRREYTFSSMMTCGNCGGRYRRKTTAAGTKYEKAVWICETYNRFGKTACPSRQIPEDILYKTTSSVLGLKEFDEQIFKKKISHITVQDNYSLHFHFVDSSIKEARWQNKSRADSWTPEMKQKAREKRYAQCANH